MYLLYLIGALGRSCRNTILHNLRKMSSVKKKEDNRILPKDQKESVLNHVLKYDDHKEAKRIAKNGRYIFLKKFNSKILIDFILSKLFNYKINLFKKINSF
tara:strand:- start:320 stop:622 length:303 start_codon:yes stop_codon:yes gene_type:complete